jgi:hypothetical protein
MEPEASPPTSHPRAGSGETAPTGPGSALDRLSRLLDVTQLARVVPHLPPEALHMVVRHRGVDACGELLAAATPAQLRSVLDLDLWRSADAGLDEQFDRARFGEWLEGLVAGGEKQAADVVARIDAPLVVAGLSGHIRVFDRAAFAPAWSSDDDVTGGGAAPYGGLACDVGGYVLRARTAESWDAIVELLVALEADHREYFHAVMRGCRRLSNSRPEVDGLGSLLADPEQLLHDVAAAREQRRSQHGYLTAADARAFLQMARRPLRGSRRTAAANPVATAYLGSSAEEGPPAAAAANPPESAADSPPADDVSQAVHSVAVLLAEARFSAERPRALLEAPAGRGTRRTRVHALLENVRQEDERAFLARNRELAFLANALMAGCSVQARPFSARDASDAALATCNLGLEFWHARWPEEGVPGFTRSVAGQAAVPDLFLADHDLVEAFQAGWAVLHESSMFVAGRLIEVLNNVRSIDSRTHESLVVLRRELVKQREAGTPWRARDALDVLAILDTPAWHALLGALDECPVVPEVLTAILEGRTVAVSATAFEFVATADQVDDIRTFAERLAPILMGC